MRTQPPPIRLLMRGVQVRPFAEQLAQNSDLWDQNVFRTEGGYGGSNPHTKVSDIIVRYNHWRNWKGDRQKFGERHESYWWAPYERLPSIQPLIFDLARMYLAEAIGMVLITRIAPGGEIQRHVDRGWHAQQYTKFALQIKGAPGQKFCYDNVELETLTGDLYSFDNSRFHWVTNPTDEERITMIICLRLRQEICTDCAYAGASSDSEVA